MRRPNQQHVSGLSEVGSTGPREAQTVYRRAELPYREGRLELAITWSGLLSGAALSEVQSSRGNWYTDHRCGGRLTPGSLGQSGRWRYLSHSTGFHGRVIRRLAKSSRSSVFNGSTCHVMSSPIASTPLLSGVNA